MLNAMDWQHISYKDIYQLIKNGVLTTPTIEASDDGKFHIFTGISGECDIEIEVDFIDAIKFYPGG